MTDTAGEIKAPPITVILDPVRAETGPESIRFVRGLRIDGHEYWSPSGTTFTLTGGDEDAMALTFTIWVSDVTSEVLPDEAP